VTAGEQGHQDLLDDRGLSHHDPAELLDDAVTDLLEALDGPGGVL
jgi:hypothetical protein